MNDVNDDDTSPDSLLRRAVLGELAADDPALQAALRQSPDLRRRYEELVQVRCMLAATARFEGEVVAAAGAEPVPGELVQLLGGLAHQARRTRVARPHRWAILLVAAAALAALVWWATSRPARRARDDVLGPRVAVVVERTAHGYGLSWTGAPRPGGYYTVRVAAADDRVLAASEERLQAARWEFRFDPATLHAPTQVRVVINEFGPDDVLVHSTTQAVTIAP